MPICSVTRPTASAYSALLGVLGAALRAVLFIYQGDLFRPSTWDKNKMETPFLIPVYFTLFCCVGLTPAVSVVLHYQKKFGDAHPTAYGGFRQRREYASMPGRTRSARRASVSPHY